MFIYVHTCLFTNIHGFSIPGYSYFSNFCIFRISKFLEFLHFQIYENCRNMKSENTRNVAIMEYCNSDILKSWIYVCDVCLYVCL